MPTILLRSRMNRAIIGAGLCVALYLVLALGQGCQEAQALDAAIDYSGVGACAANNWVSTLTVDAAPTCTQPAFSNVSGSITAAQCPDASVSAEGCTTASAQEFNGLKTFDDGLWSDATVTIATSSGNGLLVDPAAGVALIAEQLSAETSYAQFVFANASGVQKCYLGYIGSTFGAPRQDSCEIGTNTATQFIAMRPNDSEVARFSTTGLTLGATGTAIADSYAGTLIYNFGAITAPDCVDSTDMTVTGAALGDVCALGASIDLSGANQDKVQFTCYVQATNVVRVRACALVSDNPDSATWSARVFDP